MRKKQRLIQKGLSIFTGLSLIFQSFAPGFFLLAASPTVFAQEESPTPTVEQTPTPTPSTEPTVTEEVSPTPDPSVDESPTATPTPESTVTPTPDAATPTATPPGDILPDGASTVAGSQESVPQSSETQEPQNNSPPTPVPTVVAENETEENHGEVHATILPNVDADSLLDLAPPQESSSATLVTDKADYAPTDAVVITGTGFSPNTNYTLIISSNYEPQVHFETQVTTNEEGSFIYVYQLDGTYRPLYKVEVKNPLTGRVLAITTFTDSDAPSAKLSQYANKASEYQAGNLNNTNSVYAEGHSVPYRYLAANAQEGARIVIDVTYQFKHGSDNAFDFLTDDGETVPLTDSTRFGPDSASKPSVFDLTAPCTNSTTVSIPNEAANPPNDEATDADSFIICSNYPLASASVSGGVTTSGNDKIVRLLLDMGNNGDGTDEEQIVDFAIFFGGHLALDDDWPGDNNGAGDISGAPFHMKVEGFHDEDLNGTKAPGEKGIGAEERSISPEAVVIPGSITVIKDVVPNDSSLWDFSLTGPNNFSDSANDVGDSGSFTFSSLVPGSYTLSETTDPNYSTSVSCNTGESGGSSVSITLEEGENVTCTFTNEINKGTIIVEKQTDPADDPQSFTFTGDAPGSISDNGQITVSGLNPGTYTSTETVPSGWDLTNISCNDSNSTGNVGTATATFNLDPGETIICTFTNTKLPKLTVTKVVINDNGGSKQVSDFPLFVDGVPVTSGVQITSTIGTHTVSETQDPDYTATITGDCASDGSITLAAGDEKSCTITNNDEEPSLTLVKVVVNDDGGTAANTAWTLTATGTGGSPTNLSGTTPVTSDASFKADTYTLVETGGPAGYTASTYSCVKNGGAPVVANSITLGLGDTATCTITNDDQPGHLIVHKVTDPSSDTTTEFSITASGPDVHGSATQSITGGGSVDYTVDAGTYSVSEGPVAGWDETGNTCQNVVVTNGGTSECTITNTKRGHIIIVKDAIPNDAQDFTFNNNFGNGNPATFLLDDDSNGTLPATRDFEVLPGTYSVSEDVVAGWQSPESTSCTDGSPVSAIVVSSGETVTCTLVNEKLAKIILVKNTVGGDGTFDFDATGDGLPTDIDLTTSGGTATQTFENLDPDNTYTIAENVPDGWDLTSSDCTGTNTPNNITPNPGETVTCTFENTKRGHIVIDKITDPSGDSQSFDFTLTGGPSSLNQSFALTDGDSPHDSGAVLPGNGYNASEAVPAGWDLTNTSCSDGSPVNNIDVSPGETVTCTFTNTKRGHLIVNKTTSPQGDQTEFPIEATGSGTITGGGAGVVTDAQDKDYEVTPGTYSVTETVPAGWDQTLNNCVDIQVAAGATETCTIVNTKRGTIIVEKQTDPDGSNQSFDFSASYDQDGFSLTDGQTNDSGLLPPGTYSVSESVPSGWDLTSATCSDQSDPQSIDLDSGETITCIFTNTKRGHVIIVKDSINNDAQNFTFHNNFGNENPETFQLDDDSNGALPNTRDFEVLPGTYFVSEDPVEGWQQESQTCDDGSPVSAIEVSPGETVTCTFVNEEFAKIILIKNTVGGDGTFDFVMTGDGLPAGTQVTTADGSASETFSDLDQDNTYTISETVPDGWDLTSSGCSGTNSPDSITPNPGETVTCTFENTKRGEIIIEKLTDPEGSEESFEFESDYGDSFFLSDGESNNSGFLEPETYSVSELTPDGWDLTSATCSDESDPDSIELDPGEIVICTFTNTQKGTIIVEKQTIPDGSAQSFTFTGDAAGTLADNGTILVSGLLPGEYTSTEAVPSGWTLTGISCDDENSSGNLGTATATFNLEAGEVVTCTFTNTRDTGRIIIQKLIDEDGDLATTGDQTPGEGWQFDVDGTGPDTSDPSLALTDEAGFTTSGDIKTGEYTAIETIQAGFALLSASCSVGEESVGTFDGTDSVDGINVEKDEIVNCTFINTFIPPVLTISKTNNKVGLDVNPGSEVVYTLTVVAEATGGAINNVTVTDLLPDGFTYRSGSWAASSDVRQDLKAKGITPEPTYASPGVWQLGNMVAGEIVVLMYIADISGSIFPGLYKDLGWAKGEDLAEATVLAQAVDPGFVATNFVGSAVNVVREQQPGASVNIEQKVLGAAISLPATGSKTLWVILAATLFAIGLVSLSVGLALRRRYAKHV